MARNLSQVVGVMTSVRKKDNDAGTELKKKVQVEDLTTGLSKIHTPLEDMDEETARRMLVGVQPDTYKPVALTVPDALAEAMRYAIPAMDLVATNDATNQIAVADVLIPGMTAPLLVNVPVSHLLWLENYLGEWKKFISALPVLNPTKRWTPKDGGIYESDPEKRISTAKKIVPLVLHQGTDKHAPQVQAIEDVLPTGHYTTVSLSGAVYASRKKELTDRFDMVISAVKDATARANQTTAIEVNEGETLLGFLLA